MTDPKFKKGDRVRLVDAAMYQRHYWNVSKLSIPRNGIVDAFFRRTAAGPCTYIVTFEDGQYTEADEDDLEPQP